MKNLGTNALVDDDHAGTQYEHPYNNYRHLLNKLRSYIYIYILQVIPKPISLTYIG